MHGVLVKSLAFLLISINCEYTHPEATRLNVHFHGISMEFSHSRIMLYYQVGVWDKSIFSQLLSLLLFLYISKLFFKFHAYWSNSFLACGEKKVKFYKCRFNKIVQDKNAFFSNSFGQRSQDIHNWRSSA